ncbi:GlxA family transcriptional regulator [Marinomonas flavescens]|uniref:GlxA family transcriptional regulator n=1 Tax=Marinomonas flavescens TaxID=2529379 RepID=UPI001055213B|nr:helix-turn-helix domain-containing protein [Marinomonas flavescens]
MRTHNFEQLVSEPIKNSPFMIKDDLNVEITKIGFLLLDNFSIASFTSSVDTLITANLFSENLIFETKTMGINSISVESDLNINISTDLVISKILKKELFSFDIIIVCGGYRCDLGKNEIINSFLMTAYKKGIHLASLWNGVIHLANAGLMNGIEFSAHPNSHSYIKEHFSDAILSHHAFTVHDHFSSSAGINSSQEMVLNLIEKLKGEKIVRTIRDILSCDKGPQTGESIKLDIYNSHRLPEKLNSTLNLMNNNIEEPLKINELVQFSSLSRRQIERLFQKYLNSTPSKFYLEIRLNHAHRLLTQSNTSITNIAIASGFCTSSHFSNSFKDFFGLSPTLARLKFYKK